MTSPRHDSTRPDASTPLRSPPVSREPTLAPPTEPGAAPATSPAGSPRYDILGVLGRGGMATVYLAFDRLLLREVALKKLDPQLTSDDDRARFLAEAQITGQLEHPSVVPVYDLAAGDEVYFVMKRLRGRTLAELLSGAPAPRPAAALDELLGVLDDVCNAIAFAHDRHVVHRDLKPKNVIVDAPGCVYVVDWGLARVAADAPLAVRLSQPPDERDDGSGTVAYMAPEQARSGWRPIGPWTDIWALGAILHEILTGRPPHTADTLDALRSLAAAGEVSPLPATPQIPPALAHIASVATAREPQHRYTSVSELRGEIGRFRRAPG